MKEKKSIISLYVGHDSNITVYDPKKDLFRTYELEKIFKVKHFRLENRGITTKENLDSLKDFFTNVEENDFSHLLLAQRFAKRKMYQKVVDIFQHDIYLDYNFCLHHDAHTWSAYMQSPYENAFVLSYDGGGDGTCFQVSQILNGKMVWHEWKIFNFGNLFISTLKNNNTFSSSWHGLEIAGKAMGLSAYGKEIPYVDKILRKLSKIDHTVEEYDAWSLVPYHRFHMDLYKDVVHGEDKALLKEFHTIIKDHGYTDADIAFTVQKFIEKEIIKIIKENYLDKIKECDNNLIITGGVALNVLVNQLIKNTFKDVHVYVPSNPHDGGLSVGLAYKLAMHLNLIPHGKKYDLSDSGPILFDINNFDQHCQQHQYKKVTLKDISDLLKSGKIIGFIQGHIEIGPRALGNRSILCDASFPNMKDTINKRVKFREEFRPFAPICRLEDAPKYFDARDFDNTDNMAFTVNVKPEYQNKLISITHVDKTARLQTVTEKSNQTIYELLTLFGGVLLNTSFNVQGQPILNSLSDAQMVLEKTELDGYVVKHQNEFYFFHK